MNSSQSDVIHKRVINCLLFIYIFCLILSYTELSSFTNTVKFILSVAIVMVELPYINIRNYLWTGPLIIALVFLPLFLSVIGVYSTSMMQVIVFIFYFLLTLFFWISLANCYLDDVSTFINIWCFSINGALLLLFLFYKGISLNILYFINAIMSDQRYGSSVLMERYGMGFINVNTFALFSGLLIVCALYQIINKEFVVLSILDIIVGLLFILNAESRTPILALGIMVMIWIIQYIRLVEFKAMFNFVIEVSSFVFVLCFIWLLFSGSSSRVFNIVDSITSFRLSFGNLAVNNIRGSLVSLLFGVGPMKTSYVTEQLFGNSISLDNSIEYFLFTTGLIGLVIILSFFIWLVWRVCRSNQPNIPFVRGMVGYLIVYSFFENCIFIPGSPISLFCIVILFIYNPLFKHRLV